MSHCGCGHGGGSGQDAVQWDADGSPQHSCKPAAELNLKQEQEQEEEEGSIQSGLCWACELASLREPCPAVEAGHGGDDNNMAAAATAAATADEDEAMLHAAYVAWVARSARQRSGGGAATRPWGAVYVSAVARLRESWQWGGASCCPGLARCALSPTLHANASHQPAGGGSSC